MGELFWEIPSPVSFLSPPARVWNKLNTLTLSRMILHNPPPFCLFFVCCKNKLCVFKTLKAFFRLKASDICIDAQPMNLWRTSSMMLYLFSFCGSTWKVLAMANFSHQSTARVGHGHWDLTSRPQICRHRENSLTRGRQERDSLANPPTGIEFQMREAGKSFLAPVPHLYFFMTLIWIY